MSKDTESTRKEQYLKKRKELIELSKFVRMGVKSGAYDSVNEGLKEIYMETNPEIEEFKTFWQWKDEGATVRKGEKAFLIWGNLAKLHRFQTEQRSRKSLNIGRFVICSQIHRFTNRKRSQNKRNSQNQSRNLQRFQAMNIN